MAKTYLGDAVYAVVNDRNQLVLTTEDGINVTNVIYLEPEVYVALTAFAAPALVRSDVASLKHARELQQLVLEALAEFDAAQSLSSAIDVRDWIKAARRVLAEMAAR